MITLGEMAVDLKKKAERVNQNELARLRAWPFPFLGACLSYGVILAITNINMETMI